MRTIVLGMGNPILCDDAVGIRLARDLQSLAGEQHAVDYIVDCSVGGLNLLDLVTGYDRLIVFDSIRGGGGPPGTWYQMTGESFRETMNLANPHDANFTTALELGRRLGARLPHAQNVHIFAVEIADNTTFSERMSPELEACYGAFCPEIMRQALALLHPPGGLPTSEAPAPGGTGRRDSTSSVAPIAPLFTLLASFSRAHPSPSGGEASLVDSLR